MSETVKSAKKVSNSTENLPFEAALTQLESIVESMEDGDLPLEDLLTRYEEGSELAKQCQARLAEAELKIKTLEENANGELELTDELPEAID